MNDTLIAMKLERLELQMKEMISAIKALENQGLGEDTLWDSSDLMRNWNVSERTLVTWRKENLIGHVKIGGKVWYTAEDRRRFLERNHVRTTERSQQT